MADAAIDEPVNGIIDLAGPERITMDNLAREFLSAMGDSRTVVTDPNATYFGTRITDGSLAPLGKSLLGSIRFKDWIAKAPR